MLAASDNFLLLPNLQTPSYCFASFVSRLYLPRKGTAPLMASATTTIVSGGRLREMGAFALVGVANTALDFAILNGLIVLTHQDHGLGLFLCDLVAFTIGMISSFFLNARVTFRQQGPVGSVQVARFIGVSLVGLLINGALVWAMSPILGHALPGMLAVNGGKLIATGASMIWNYLALRAWVFAS
jgi:putative flippase GtrA